MQNAHLAMLRQVFVKLDALLHTDTLWRYCSLKNIEIHRNHLCRETNRSFQFVPFLRLAKMIVQHDVFTEQNKAIDRSMENDLKTAQKTILWGNP